MKNKIISRAFSYIDERKAEMLETMKEFIEHPSSGREPEDVKATAPWLCELLEKEGFKCEMKDPGHGNGCAIVAVNGDTTAQAPVLFTGHYDTALYKKIAAQNPFRIEDGRMYGSGVLDMKGGIIIALYAVKALKSVGYTGRPIKFVLSGDEEVNHVGSRGAEIMVEEARGGLCAFNMETGLVSNKLVTGRKGGVRCKITVNGVEAHSGNDFTKGRSAIVEMAYKIIDIHNLTNLETGTTMNIGTINGGTIFNSIPAKCEIIVDMRFKRNDELEKAKKAFKKICEKTYIEGTTTTMEYIDIMHVFETTADGTRLFEFLKRTAEDNGLELLESMYLGGSSDAAYTTMAGVPTVCSCGTMGEWNHTIREYALVDSLYSRAKLFAAAVINIEDFSSGN